MFPDDTLYAGTSTLRPSGPIDVLNVEFKVPRTSPPSEAGAGSSGVLSSPQDTAALAAEIVASAITGDPLPVEASLLKALAPSRFVRRGRILREN